MRAFSIVFFFFIGYFDVFAQNTLITIDYDGLGTKEIKLYFIHNPFTLKETVVATTTAMKGRKGEFTLAVSEISHYYLESGDAVKEIYLQPQKSYQLKLEPSGKSFIWLNNSDEGINRQIEQINVSCNQFISKYFKSFSGNIPRGETKKFLDKLNSDFGGISAYYIKIYLHYKNAYIKRVSGLTHLKLLVNEYLNDSPFLYVHPAYMDFVQLTTDGYMEVFLAGKYGNEARKLIYENKSYRDLYNVFLRDTIWKKEAIRHYILLAGLKELSFNKEFQKSDIVQMLKSASETIKLEPINRWAKELYIQESRFLVGKPVPDATFTLSNGKTSRIADYKGKPIYISYFPKGGYYAGAELAKLKSLHNKLSGKIHFITIIDEIPHESLDNFAKRNSYMWTLGALQDKDNFKEIYNANDDPAFYLIDAKGHTFQIPAEAPSTDVEMQFPALLRIKP